MDAENKIKIIGLKLYIQLLLLDRNIIKRIKIKNEEKIINFLQVYYKKFYYSFTNFYVTISKKSNIYKVNMNNCNKNINPCKFISTNKKYTIQIEFIEDKDFNQSLNTFLNKKMKKIVNKEIINKLKSKKVHIPIQLFEFQCSDKNVKLLIQFIKKIKNIFNKDIYLKKIIKNIEFTEN